MTFAELRKSTELLVTIAKFRKSYALLMAFAEIRKAHRAFGSLASVGVIASSLTGSSGAGAKSVASKAEVDAA